MNSKTFEELYCEQRSIAPEAFARAAMRESLYLHARLLYPLVNLLWPDHFVADLDLVRSTGRLRRVRDFRGEVEEFVHHPANRGALRHVFNVRVSTKRLRHLLRSVLHGEEGHGLAGGDVGEDGTLAPFGGVEKMEKGGTAPDEKRA